MMTSNLLSRLLPSVTEDRGGHRQPRPYSDTSDPEDPHRLDEENLGARFQDQDIEELLAEAAQSEMTTESTAFLPGTSPSKPGGRQQPKWMSRLPARPSQMEDEDDDVPESLLLEGGPSEPSARAPPRGRSAKGAATPGDLPPPVPGPSTNTTRAQWNATRAQQRLYKEDDYKPAPPRFAGRGFIADPKEKAMWKWTNVDDLDMFLRHVYEYWEGCGIWSILLRRVLNLLMTGFAIFLFIFLTNCIDWSLLSKSKKLPDIVIPKCTTHMPAIVNFFIWLFVAQGLWNIVAIIRSVPRLWDMHNFFHYVLEVPDSDMQTVAWQHIVSCLMSLRDSNPATNQNLSPENRRFINGQSKQRMDAQDIANRLMRRENYLIAMINKDILDTTVQIPFIGKWQFFSKTIEWNVALCIMDFVFDEHGRINPVFLTTKNRHILIAALKRRIAIAGIINIFCAPFLVIYYCLMYFFRYSAELQKNPSMLGLRAFTPLAEWKFREFNELWHVFQRRRNMSYPYAARYLEQFPKDRMTQLCQFVCFVSGAIAAILGLCMLLDSESFIAFEILPGRTALFVLGVAGGIFGVARGAIPDADLVLDPEYAIRVVIEHTHYCPKSWEGRLHSDEVRREFSALYKPKTVIFLEEALSIILTPYVLLRSLPNSVEAVVDFFKDFTVHVDGLGHICSFAEFNFEKNENGVRSQPPNGGLREDYYNTKDQKNWISYVTFMEEYRGNAGGKGTRSMHRRTHLPPPSFPGVLPGSQQLAMRQSAYRGTPRFGPTGMTTAIEEPIHSVLLDAHHQPSPAIATMRGSPHQGQQRNRHTPRLADADEEAEVGERRGSAPGKRPQQVRTSSKVIAEDSELGDSWRTDREEEVEDEGSAGMVEKGAGVLGMLYHFQRAQAEGKGVGI